MLLWGFCGGKVRSKKWAYYLCRVIVANVCSLSSLNPHLIPRVVSSLDTLHNKQLIRTRKCSKNVLLPINSINARAEAGDRACVMPRPAVKDKREQRMIRATTEEMRQRWRMRDDEGTIVTIIRACMVRSRLRHGIILFHYLGANGAWWSSGDIVELCVVSTCI